MKQSKNDADGVYRYYCEHCHQYLAYTTFKKHKKNYLDNTMNTEHSNVECAPFDLAISDSEEEMQDVEFAAQVAGLHSI